MAASLVAAVVAIEERRRREHEQAAGGIEIARLVDAQGSGVCGEDLVAAKLVRREATGVRLGQRSTGD